MQVLQSASVAKSKCCKVCKGAKLTAKKNKVTSKQTSKQTNIVTSSLLELLVAAKKEAYQKIICVGKFYCN